MKLIEFASLGFWSFLYNFPKETVITKAFIKKNCSLSNQMISKLIKFLIENEEMKIIRHKDSDGRFIAIEYKLID
jgi:hypothetical protein